MCVLSDGYRVTETKCRVRGITDAMFALKATYDKRVYVEGLQNVVQIGSVEGT